MKIQTLITSVLLTSLLVFSCLKDELPRQEEDPSSLSLQDSVNMLIGKWKLVKDSSTNIGGYYFIENGTAYYPNPGEYFGIEKDYMEFFANGTTTMHANQQTYTSEYQLFPNNRLVIKDMLVHDTGKVVTLTEATGIFDWSNTSPNGGKFFRRTYLEK